ncbi:MAG: NusG domain II-containing protein [Candidatus Cloacimonetes bacterium]|nr:NusG domain II-containing protein [Candidatus Cloacimonadota bacterium]
MYKKFLQKFITKTDIGLIIIIIFIAFVSGFLIFQQKNSSPNFAICKINGKVVKKISLNSDKIINLENGMQLEIKNGKIRVVSSNCAEQICVKHSWISNLSDIIVCAPNRCIIYLEGYNQTEYITK